MSNSDIIAAIASFAAFLQFLALVITIFVLMRTAKRQLRAYLSIESARRDGEHQYCAPEFKATITLKNCGQTPAYDGAIWCSIYASPQDSPIPALERIDIAFEMPPGNSFPVSQAIDTKNLLFSDDAISGFDTGKVAIYILGRVEFKDAFGEKRWFSFRLRYDQKCFASGELNTEEIKSN